MELLVTAYASEGKWLEMWLSIKMTLFFDGKGHDPDLLKRLEALEKLSAPTDAYSEIEAYAFTNTWEHAEVKGGDYSENVESVKSKIVMLRVLAASDPKLLTRLGPRLWEKQIDALWSFGKGLAEGSDDESSMFSFLVDLMKVQKLAIVDATLFAGFFHAVHENDPIQARALQEKILTIDELKPNFVYLLSSTPIAPWGAKMLYEVARSGELEAWRFEQIRQASIHKTISDSELATLLRAVTLLERGALSTLKILEMRFFIDKKSDYVPNSELRAVGREAIRAHLSMQRDDIKRQRLHREVRVLDQCLTLDTPREEAKELVELICDGLVTYRLYGHDVESVLEVLAERFPEILLDRVFNAGDEQKNLAHFLFKDHISKPESCLNSAPVGRLLDWCAKDENKIQFVMKAVSVYTAVDKKYRPMDNPKEMVLSDHAMALLNVAKDKLSIAEGIFSGISPSSWFGSRASILEVRAKAFVALIGYKDDEVSRFAKTKMAEMENTILLIREDEAKEDSQREQRFE